MALNDDAPGAFGGLGSSVPPAEDSLYSAHMSWLSSPNREPDLLAQAEEPLVPQVNYADGPDPAAKRIGRASDIFQLDTDPFGDKTVRYGERTGMTADYTADTVAGLSVFGKEIAAETLQKTEAGRRLLELGEKNRRGVKRGFLDAITDFQWSDLPFLGLVASVGGSIADAVTVNETMKKLQNGEPVSDDELIKTRLYMAEQEYRSNGSWGATVGDIIRAAPGFMVEFLASGGTLGAARTALYGGSKEAIHLGMTRASKTLAREATEHFARESVEKAAGKTFAGIAEGEARERIVNRVAGLVASKTMTGNPMYKGMSAEAIQSMAKARAEHEFAQMLARNAHGAMRNNLNRFTQWLGQNVSRGLMDFGTWGAEESTVLFTNHTKAGRALADAVGTFFVEAPIKGALLMAPNAYAAQPLVAAAAGADRTVSQSELSLRQSALMTGNRELMENAESIAFGMNLLEYVSENTGRGLKSLVRAAGLGLENAGMRGLVRPASSEILGIVPTEGETAVAFGGKIRQWIGDVFGSRESFLKKAQGQKAEAVIRALGVTAEADRSAIRTAVMSGSSSGLRQELRDAVGGNVEAFAQKALKKMYDDGVKDLQYKSYARFAVANWMAKHQIGPETVMNMYEQMGYDGILGEMFEERYSDVVKGMLGLDDRAEHDFFSNLKEAVKGLYPGWDQLTAEAVGFAMPMVTRAATLRLQSAVGGGGKLQEIRARLAGIEDALRHDSVVSMKFGTYLAAHDAMAEQDRKEVAELQARLDEADAAGDKETADSIRSEIETREKVSTRREERHQKFLGTLSDAAKANADSIVNVPLLASQQLASDEVEGRTPALSSEQAGETLEGQAAMVDYAPELARVLYEAEAPLEGEDPSWFRKAAHKIVGLAGAVVSGDMSLAATNPAQWTARDMGLSANVCRALKEGFRAEWRRQADVLRDRMAAEAAAAGRGNGSFSPSRKAVTDAAAEAFAGRAKQIMGAYLAAHQLRSFSDGRIRDQALAHVAKSEGLEHVTAEDGSVSFVRFDEAAGAFDQDSAVSASDFYESHRDAVDRTAEKLAVATADILTRRLTKSFDADMRILNMVRLPASSDMVDAAIYDCALHMIGGQNLAYVQNIDGEVPLREAIYSSSVGRVSMPVVDYLARFDSVDHPDLDRRALESVAWSLNLRFDGTAAGLAERDRKILNMAKLATMLDRGDLRHFAKTTRATEDDLRVHSTGAAELTARETEDGRFEVDFGIKTVNGRAERDLRTFDDEEALRQEMSRLGYAPTKARILLSQAKVVECTDMFKMIRELDLAPDYIAALGENAPRARLHPMLRRKADGHFVDEDWARERLARELSIASHWDPEAQVVIGDAGVSDKTVRSTWMNVWGPNGYMRVGERLLADRKVSVDTMSKYAGEFSAYSPKKYTLSVNVGKLSANSSDIVVPVDPSVNPDMTSGLVNAVLMRAYASHGRLIRNALNGVVSDFVHEVDAIAETAMQEARDANDTELVRSLAAFRRECTAEVDREATTSDGRTVVRRGVGLTPTGFVTLAGAFCAYQDRKYAESPYLRAVAKIAPAVRRAASFMDFTNLVDLTLGGNGFLDAAVENAAGGVADAGSQRGIRQLMSYAAGNPNALRDAVRESLPGGLGYTAFLNGCITRLSSMAKSGAPVITEEEKDALRASARQAESGEPDAALLGHYTFVGQLYGVVRKVLDSGRDVPAATAEFFRQVAEDALASDSGSTEQQRIALRASVREMKKAATVDESLNEYARVKAQYEDAARQVETLRNQVVNLRRQLLEARRGRAEAPAPGAIADAQTALDAAANDLTERKHALDEATKPVQSVLKGGRSAAADGARNASDNGTADDGERFSTMYGEEEPAPLPSAFGTRARSEERAFAERYGAETLEGRRMTRSQARLAVNVCVRSALSFGEGVSEETVAETARRMFPALADEELDDIRVAYRVADAARIRSNAGWDGFVVSGAKWRFSQEEKESEDVSSDNFNDQALAEYNSEAMEDFLALAQRVSPETGRNLQGFLRLAREASRMGVDRAAELAEDYPDEARGAIDFLFRLLNPKMNPAGRTQAEHDALHRETLLEFDSADSPADRHVKALLADAGGYPLSRRGAFLVAYLSALPREARIRFGKLMAHSVAASPIRLNRETGRMSPAFRAAHGKVGENIVTNGFAAIVGKSRQELRDAATRLRTLVDELRGSGEFAALGQGSSARSVLERNASLVAEILASEFGTESPLYSALASGLAHNAWADLTEKRIRDLAASVSFRENKKGAAEDIDLVETVCSTLDALAESGSGPVRRSEVATAFTAAFATGNPRRSSLREAKRSPSISDPLMTFLTTFSDALPTTIMTAEIDPERDSEGSSVVISPRDLVPIVAKWLYKDGKLGGVSFAEVCEKAFGVTDPAEINRCRQDACWPDARHTPICAKNVSASYDSVELREACRKAYADTSQPVYWVQVFSGDHGSSTLLQVPRAVRILPDGSFLPAAQDQMPEDNPTYRERKGKTGSHVLPSTGNKHKAKDQDKFNQLGGITRFIGFGPGSTGAYAEHFADIANTGRYTSQDVVGVSVNGKVKGRVGVDDQALRAELDAATKAGAVIVADKKDYRTSSSYNIGEKELAEYLESNGYAEIEGSGIWVPEGRDTATYDQLAKGVSKAIGLDRMFTDAKRSAISSLEAQGTGMIGVETQTVEPPAPEGEPVKAMLKGSTLYDEKGLYVLAFPATVKKLAALVPGGTLTQKFTPASKGRETARGIGASTAVVEHEGRVYQVSYDVGEDGLANSATYTRVDGRQPEVKRRFGENRVHILKIRRSERMADAKAQKKFDKLAAEAWKGSTFMRGYGAQALKEMAQDPRSATLKAHVVSTQGEDLFFGKSLSVATGEEGGQFLEGSSERLVMDYLEKWRGSDRLSTDFLTDFDSYKIGVANSKALRVGGKAVMEHVFSVLESLAASGVKFDKMTGDELDEKVGTLRVEDLAEGTIRDVKLSELMPGVVANSVDGFDGETAIDLSYQENGAMAYTVANVSHTSGIPAEPGRAARNYEVDAVTMATALTRGGWMGEDGTTVPELLDLVANWGLVAGTVYSDPRMAASLRRQSQSLLELARYGESPRGQNALEELARMVWSKTRQASNLPLSGIDAPLVSSGSFCDDEGNVFCHSKSPMHRAMMQGSTLFTADEARFFGVPRRVALCNVNVRSNGFRYGWFLDEEAFESSEAFAADIAAAELDAAGSPGADTRGHVRALALGRAFTRLRDLQRRAEPGREGADEAKAEAKKLREAIADVFLDHHGQKISEHGDRYVERFGIEDLFMRDADRGRGDVFDLSAVQFGDDAVTLDADGKSHLFLGGTMFGLPRTPSYNGSMWLQVVRAGLPVTEIEYEGTDSEGKAAKRWKVGRDAMVSPDPTTNAILGCDHDGDKTKLYMLTVDADGSTRFSNPPAPSADASTFASDPSARDRYLGDLAAAGFLQKTVWNDEEQREEDVPDGESPEGWYYRVAEPVRRRVSNSFVRGLFSMARRLPTDAEEIGADGRARVVPRASEKGGVRRKFLGGIASRPTNPFPTSNKDAVMEHALPPVLDADHTIGDPETASVASAAALDASKARGVIVSLARSLHLAWTSGFFTSGDMSLFNGDESPADWFRFMYHVDGLSNATFDDLKEQMCGRLGWTSGMMDTVITELLINRPGGGRLPVTDEDFAKVLASYSSEVKSKGRFWQMLRASRVGDMDARRYVCSAVLGGGDRLYRSNVVDAFGIEGSGTAKDPWRASGDPSTYGAALVAAVESVADGLAEGGGRKAVSAIVEGVARGRGSNPMAGYVAWLVREELGLEKGESGATAMPDGSSQDIVAALAASPRVRDFAEWILKRQVLMSARSFGNSVNYLVADPGDDMATGRRDRTVQAFKSVVQRLGDDAASRDRAVLMLPNGRTYDLMSAFERMHAATRLSYEIGDGLRTVAARAITAAERRFAQTFPEQFRDAAEDVPGKRRALAKLLLRDGLDSWDRLALQSNAQQLPYVCGLFRSMADLSVEVGDTFVADGRGLYSALKAIASGARDALQWASPNGDFSLDPGVLEMRQGIEAMFTLMYELMSTSREYNRPDGNKAIAYVRLAPDRAYGEVEVEDERTGKPKTTLPYGEAGRGLSRLVANFQANDDESILRIRAMFAEVIAGAAFGGTRHHNEDAADASSIVTRTFSLSRESIEQLVTEKLGRKFEGKSDEERLDALDPETRRVVVKARAALFRLEEVFGEGVAVTPSMMFGQLIPAYTVLTSRTLGAPTPQSPSIVNLLPARYYESLSDAEAELNAADEGFVDLLVSTDWAPKSLARRKRLAKIGAKAKRRLVADTSFSEEDYDSLAGYAADTAASLAGSDSFYPAVSGALARVRDKWRRGVSEGRENPDFRNSCDIFADDVFSDILDYMDGGWGDSYRRAASDSAPARAGEAAGGFSVPQAKALKDGQYDPRVAEVALAMSAMLGSWASVEYSGGPSFVIRGALRGDAGANARAVLSVTVGEGPLCDTPEQVSALADSREYAESLCASADLGITPDDFLRMPRRVREGLVRRYGVGGATMNRVVSSVDARGIATLCGAIRLPADAGTKVYHEYFHAMMRMFDACGVLSAEDRSQLAKRFNADGSDAWTGETEERMAEAFRKWVEGNTEETAEVRGVFRRIFDFLRGLFEALVHGFSYEEMPEDTIFKMAVHGITQTSDARRKELLGEDLANLDQASVAEAVRARLAETRAAMYAGKSEAELLAEAAAPREATGSVEEIEDTPGAVFSQEDVDASREVESVLAEMLDDPATGADALKDVLSAYAPLRAEMAEAAGLEVKGALSGESYATRRTETVVPGSNEARDAEVAAAARAATYPMVEASDFYRTARMINQALEEGLRSGGSWQRPLEYIRAKYAAPVWDSAASEALDRAAVLHGLRRALVTINPEAAAALDDLDIAKSLAFEAALRMYHSLESSFLAQTRVDGRTGNVLTNAVGARQARHASQFQVSAWIMSAKPSSATELAREARDEIRSILASTTGGTARAEVKMHLDMMEKLLLVVGDQTRLMEYRRTQGMRIVNDVISTLRAGVKDVTFDDNGFMDDLRPIDVDDPEAELTPENIHTENPRSAEHLRTFLGSWRERGVQRSLKLALTTAWQVAAMAKFYQELDVVPATAEDIAFQREIMRRHHLPPHVTAAEWAANQAIGDSNLVDQNQGLVDYFNQSFFIANNCDAWLSSLVRKSFGAQDNIGTMMAAENREYAAVKGEIARLENYYSFLFGDNVEDGGEILKLLKQKGEYAFEDGSIVRREGDEYVKFDNYRRVMCRVRMTEDDLRTIDLYKKMCAGHANGQKEIVTGVDRLYFSVDMADKGADFYSRESVMRRWNEGNPAEQMDALEIALVRLTKQLPESIIGKDGLNLYDRLVNGAVAAMRRARAGMARRTESPDDSALFNSLVIGDLRRSGLVVGHNPGGKRWADGRRIWKTAAVSVRCDDIDRMFKSSAAYAKLTSKEGGRTPQMLDRDRVASEFMAVYRKAVMFAKQHPWLTHGDGRYFNAFGTALPFWRGTGVFMYNAVRANRNAAEEMLGELPAAEAAFVKAANSADATKPVASLDPSEAVPLLDMLADAYGVPERGMALKDLVAAGEFAVEGEGRSARTGLVLAADATKADVARAVYDRLVDIVWDQRIDGRTTGFGAVGNGLVDAAKGYGRRKQAFDVRSAERVLAALESGREQAGELFGGRVGITDEQAFRRYGVLPANYQIGHKVHAAIDGLTNAMMARSTLVNMLLTPAHDGAPTYYADPAQHAAELSGVPDELWHQIARWWSEYNGLSDHGYDPAKSGVQNAHDIFTALHEAGKDGKGGTRIGGKRYVLVSGDDGDVMSVNGWLVREDDQLGEESSALNALGGGEALGYLKQFTQAGRILGFGGPAVRATLHRCLSWSKSMSVSFSFFFPLATKWESPIGAVGAMATMCSNLEFMDKWAKSNPELFAGVQKLFGGKGWITKDFLGFQDIMRMMDSNDPFLAELYAWGSALGVTFSSRLVNPMEPTKSAMASDINRLKEALRRNFGAQTAAKFGRIMETMALRQGDKAFSYALNATKLAVIAQLAMKLRHQAQARGKAFDPVRDLKRYGGYINAEIGGIDPLRYAWAHPMNRALMNTLMFSWQWTRGAWEAGGGGVIEDMLFGGHSVTRQEREYLLGRWCRMFGAVMIGVPALMQCLAMGLAKCLGGGDDDDDRWFTWQNEDKTRWTAFDLTPLLKAIERFDDTRLGGALKAFKKNGGPAAAMVGGAAGAFLGGRGGNWLTGAIGGAMGAGVGSLVPSLVPMYTGDDAANRTSRNRRYYMHFGKQGWEFFRWFDDASAQFFSKLSMPTQRILEGIMGRNLAYLDRALPWDDKGQFERWLDPTTDGALFNLAQAFLPFTVGGVTRTGDAGILPVFGPVQMGASQTNIQDRLEKALTAWAYNDRANYAFGARKGRGSMLARNAVNDILADARRNGLDPRRQLDKALGRVLTRAYGEFFEALPDDLSKPFDTERLNRVARVLDRLGAKRRAVMRSIRDRMKAQGRDWKKNLTPEERAIMRAVIRGSLKNPYRTLAVEPPKPLDY